MMSEEDWNLSLGKLRLAPWVAARRTSPKDHDGLSGWPSGATIRTG
jgi:hypothetical protein